MVLKKINENPKRFGDQQLVNLYTLDCRAFIFQVHANTSVHVTYMSLVLYPHWHVSKRNMSFTKKTGNKALDALQNLPRITLANLRPEPGAKKPVSIC